MKRKLFLLLALMLGFVSGIKAVDWTDKTSVVTNPSFETGDAISDLTTCGWATNRVTGWTIAPESASNAQVGIGNSSSKLQGIGSNFSPSDGDKYFYVRQNWNAGTEFSISQTIVSAEVPNGLYKLTVKMANFASATSTFTLSLQEEGQEAVTNSITSTSSKWNEWSVMLVKESDATSLAIKAAMKYTGSDAGSRHFSFLLDNVKLEYVSDPSSVTASSPLDVTDMVRNPSFENDNAETASPACWTIQSGSDKGAKLNSNATYTTSGVDGSYVFNIWGGTAPYKVSQTVQGLPEGYYKLTALIASDQYQNIQVYCGNGKVYDSAANKGTGKNITTEVAYVSNGSMEIGATSYSWFKCDNFRLYYLGATYEASSSNPLAITDRANLAWNVGGTTVQWGIQLRETYNGSTTNIIENDRLTQTINELPNGNYRVKLWAEASNANGVAGDHPADGTIVAQLYANDATADVGLTTQNSVAGGTLDLYTIDTEVTTHSLKMGLNATANGANWHIIQIENLLYTGPLDMSSYEETYNNLVSEAATAKSTYPSVIGEELTNLNNVLDETFDTTSPDAYDDINGRLRTLIDAYVAAAPNYDALIVEIAKAKALGIDNATADGYAATSSSTAATALTSTQSLMVAEYNYATENYATPIDLGAWTETGTNTMPATFSNEHWSGTTREYKNQNDNNGQGYNAASWSMGLDQDIVLPAGDYVFKVAGRKSADATMTLTVTNKATSAVLGTVADFPSGNSSRGINKSGATAFEGGNDEFAHGGAGYGWQWRYVPFSLDAETTVNIAVTAGSSLIHNWASFGDYAVWSKPNAAASMIAYNKAKEDAGTAKTTYPQVTGSELTELNAALDADPGSTVETIDAATALIKTKTSALIAAAPSYDAYVLAKSYGEAINSTLLPYASTAKLSAVTTALSASVTSAATAETATAAINTANRAAYESNMNAEGVTGAKNRTSLVINADANGTDGWTGAFGRMSNEPYTEADGTASNTYFDKNGVKSFTSSQTIKLVAGTYILSVTARAQAGIDSYKLKVTNNADETEEVALTAIGNANGVFNRGWNVATVEFTQKAFGDATISIEADNTTSDANLWMSWDRFRLVSIADEGSYSATIGTTGWTTFASAYPLDLSKMTASTGNVKAYYASSVGDGKIVVTSTESEGVAARTGLMLKGTAGATITIPVTASGDAISGNMLVGCPNGETLTANANYYVLIKNGETAEFQSLKTNGATIPAGKAYLNTGVNSSARLIISFDDEDPTAINAIEAAEAETGALKDGKYLIGLRLSS